MKKVLLLGDSIRMGYDKYVKSALEGAAEVYYPDENARFVQYVLRYASNWKKTLELSEDIDLDRAMLAKENAENALSAAKDEQSEKLAKAKLSRALTRISVVSGK